MTPYYTDLSKLVDVYTNVQNASGNWQSTYTTVCSISSTWARTSQIIPTVTNYLSTNNIFISSLSVTNNVVATNLSASSGLFGRAQDSVLSLTSTNTVQNSTVALAISSLNTGLQLLVPAPTYNQPVATLTNFSVINYEIGANVSDNLVLGFTQNDAGTPTQFESFRNNVSILAQVLPFTQVVSESAALGTTTYRNTVTHGQGPVKNNILGLPDERGRIAAGTKSIDRSYNGYYRWWVGSVAAFPGSPNNVRTLNLSTGLDIASTNLAQTPIYIDKKFILIAIPNTRVLTNVVTDTNETLTPQFSLSSVFIQDPSGTNRAYKLYYLETALPLFATLTNVTIANA